MATIEQRIYNGDRAKEVLENEAFDQAFTDMKTEIIEQWTNSPVRDEAGREKLYQLLRLADKLKANLVTSLETGKMARLELEHQESMLSKAKRVVGLT